MTSIIGEGGHYGEAVIEDRTNQSFSGVGECF